MEEESLEVRINRATNPLNKEQDWEGVQAFCDQLNQELEGPQLATRLLAHKIQSPQEWEAMQALTVLEACMKSCGKRFHSEVGKFRFLNELIKVVSPKYLGSRSPEKVKLKILELLYSWTLGLPGEVKIAEAYQMLKKQGIIKEDPKLPPDALIPPPPPRAKNAIFDDDEKSKMLARLLKSTHPEDLRAANKLIKEMVQEDQKRMEKISKRVNAIEEVNNNVRLLGDMLSTYKAGQTSEGSEDLMKELYQRCEKMRPTLFRLASDTEDNDEALAEILQANDSLTQVINQYRQVVKGEEVNGEAASSSLPASSSALLDLSGLDMMAAATPLYPSAPAQPLQSSFGPPAQATNSMSLLDDELMSLGLNDPVASAHPLESSAWNNFQSPETNPPVSNEKVASSHPQPVSQGSKALEDLDLLGKTLLQQSLPPTAQQVRWEKPNQKPTLRDLQTKNTHSSHAPQPIVGQSVGGEQPALSPEKKEISLANISVPLESIRPSCILPVIVYDQRSFRVLFHFAKDPPPGRPDVLVVVISMLSTAPLPVTEISFQAAVPKTMKVKLQPASGNELPSFNPILPPSSVTQVLLLANPTQEKVRLRYKLTYTQGDQTFDEMGDVEDFPPVEKWGDL
ncbi:ADP-ribosylation factor-binding protein GGA1 [Xenopus tropicalis]|uniref:ADP-ribosylation factor-binding protein GGA1 n=1 Tax=Xenopus tropicalis TaxID=8364 RepID=Q28E38_XENTR|nr:ADP-ribosylation factor-binding protein GGA1 [Xenopus tropicalis]CAJ82212.1 golgi associated, gamma adaptin ear containing, ARF binding protein 1 [Xenopus tropicalis]|eukprot:NP_001016968.1 ADP-ribosylation factor-binding protein GGA1 [Xenopus tropicalis]